jgi:hypothetical protein
MEKYYLASTAYMPLLLADPDYVDTLMVQCWKTSCRWPTPLVVWNCSSSSMSAGFGSPNFWLTFWSSCRPRAGSISSPNTTVPVRYISKPSPPIRRVSK